MIKIELSVATEFSRTPGPRYIREGNYSGELFREKLLSKVVKRAIDTGVTLWIDLDGTAGYGTSFLEEAFGGLVREDRIDAKKLREILEIKSEEEDYLIQDIFDYISDAEASEAKESDG
jgi:hypothetical protein